MVKPESILVNEMSKILLVFEIQMVHQILARKPNLALISKKKRTCHLVDFVILADY